MSNTIFIYLIKIINVSKVNAASKGHVDVVKYLLKQNANPLIKNSIGETAYDVAAASRELHVCEILERAEREWWKGKRTQSERMFHVSVSCSLPTHLLACIKSTLVVTYLF